MSKTNRTKTTVVVEYPADEFAALIKEKIFGGLDVDIDFVIEEVVGDPLDRFPGVDTLTSVRVTINGPAAT